MHACHAIDTHAHWYPEEWLKLFVKDGAAEGASLERAGKRYTIRTNRIVNAFDEEFVDLRLRPARIQPHRPDAHALSLTAPIAYSASPALRRALSHAHH